MQAANKITAIVTTYMERFSIRKAPVFLSYYVFTASITHVSTRTSSSWRHVRLRHLLTGLL